MSSTIAAKSPLLSNKPIASGLKICTGCDARLPLRSATPGELSLDWICVRCEAVYHAVLIQEYPEEIRSRVRLSAFRFAESELPPPTEELARFAARLSEIDSRNERRTSSRRAYSVPVSVIALTEALKPVGTPFSAMTRNISASGISLVNERPLDTKYLAVQLSRPDEKSLQLAVAIARQRPLGGFFEIAGQFISRMHS